MKKYVALIALLVLGIGASVAVAAATTTTATNCATTTAASHTVAVDGSGVDTVGGDTLSVCATATATNSTVTTTVPGPTTTVTTTVGTTTTPPPPPSYLFDDEFNGAAGTAPSAALWNAKTGTSSSGVKWGGFSNATEDGNGNLNITATCSSNCTAAGSWTSAFLSGNVAGFSVGGSPYDIQARAKVACGQGTWSSPVWTWGAPYGSAPSIENDVIEHLDGVQPDGYHGTLHNWNSGSNPQNSQLFTTPDALCGAFHTYEAKVYSDHIDYYYDGTLEGTATASSVGLTNLLSSQQVPNISLNMGGWGGTIGSETSATMLVDYIRVSALS